MILKPLSGNRPLTGIWLEITIAPKDSAKLRRALAAFMAATKDYRLAAGVVFHNLSEESPK